MASGLINSPNHHLAASSFPAPLAILTQLTISSAAVGLTAPDSAKRPVALALAASCTYGIVAGSKEQMRPRWASLLGGASFMFLLQYLDLGLVRRWNWRDRGPAQGSRAIRKEGSEGSEGVEYRDVSPAGESGVSNESSWWRKFEWAWSSMFALRHVNTPHQSRNTPPFSSADPSYVPSKSSFLLREGIIAVICYLILDLLGQRAPSPNAPQLFDKSLIPVFRRLGEVTLPQIRLRALSIGGFALTFWALIRGYAAAAGTVTVSLGINEPRDWRPPFGSMLEAYSIQNLWGKVWHQNLRSLLTSPASKISCDVLKLPRGSLQARFTSVFISFALSGVMHTCAGVAAGMSAGEFGVLQFFCTQALGVLIEDLVRQAYSRITSTGKEEKTQPPSLLNRCIGYTWVAAFMIWSGPVWLYPQASRPPPLGTNTSFLPYSVIRAWKMRDIHAGW